MSLRLKPQKQGLNNSRSSIIERRDKISNIPIYSDEELDNLKSKFSVTEEKLLCHESKVRDIRTELLEKALAEKTKLGLVNLGAAKQSSALQALCCYSPESRNSPSNSPREDSFDLERIVREKRTFKIAEAAKEKKDRYQFKLQQLDESIISEKAEVDSEESSKPLRSILKVKTSNDLANQTPLIEQQKLDTSLINMSAFSSISFENIEDEDKFLYGDSASDELTKKESDDLFSINRSERNLSENSGWSDDDDFVHPCNKVSEKESWTNFTPRPVGNYHIKSPISEMKDAFYDKCIKEERNRESISSDVHEDTIIDLKLPSNAWKNALILEESNAAKILESADNLSEFKQNLKEKHSDLEKNKFHRISKRSPNSNLSTVPKYGSSGWKNVSNWKDHDALQTKPNSIIDKSSEKHSKDPLSNIQSNEQKDKSSNSDSDSSDSEPKSPSAVELLMYHGFKTKRSSPSAGLSKSESETTSAQKPNSVQPAKLSSKQPCKLNFQLDNKPHSNQSSVSDFQPSNNSGTKQHNISTYEKKQKSISPQITKTSLQSGRSHMQSVKPISMQLKPRLITELKKTLKMSQSLETQPAKYISAQEKSSILNFKTSNKLSQATLKLLPHPVQKIQISKTSVGNKRMKENLTCAKDFSSAGKDIDSDGKKSSFGNELNSSSTPDFRKINSQKGQSVSKCKMLKSDHHSQAIKSAKVKKEVNIKHKNLPEKELCDQLPKRYWSESHKYWIESPSSQKEQYERLPSSSNQTTPERVTVDAFKKRAGAKHTQEKKLSTWKKASYESLQSTGTDSHKRHRSKSPDYYRERKRHIQSSTEKERSLIKGSHEKYSRKSLYKRTQRQNSHEKSQRERFERNSEAYYAKTSERDFYETISGSSDNSRDNAQEKDELRKNVAEKKSPISHQQDADRHFKQRHYGIENLTDSADDISISLLLKKVHHTNTLFSDTQENNLSLPNSATQDIQNSHSLAPGTPLSHPGSSQSALTPSPLPQEQSAVLPSMNCPVSTYPHPLAYEQPMEMQPLPYPVVDNNYHHPFMPPPMCSSYELSYNPYMVQPPMLPPEPQMHQYHPLHAAADITPSHTTRPYSFPQVTVCSSSDTKPYFSTLRTNLTVIPLQSDLNTVQQQPPVVTTSESNCKTAELLNTRAKSEVCSSPLHQEEQPCISLQRQKELMARKTDVKSQMSILSKEFERLRKMQGEMMRKKQREKDGHKDQLIMENNKLQDEISGQLSNLVKEAKEIERELQKIPKKKAGPPVEEKTPDTSIAKVTSEIKSTKESMDIAEEFYFEYFDPGSHWCKLCNEVQPTIFRMLEHLQSNKHKQHMDPYDRPWIPDPPKKNENGKAEKKVITAAKGIQFILPIEGFYCSLCKQCFGDQICAEEHLMSYEHNFIYGKYLAENPVYERRWNLDKSAGLAVIVKQTKRHAEEKKAEQAKRQKKNEKETQKQQVIHEEKKHIKLPKEQEETPKSMISAKHKSKGIKLTLIGEKGKMKHESKKYEKNGEKKTAKLTNIVHIGKAPNFKSRIAAKFDTKTQDAKIKFSKTDVEKLSSENSKHWPNSLYENISRNEIAFINVNSTASIVSSPITTASLSTAYSSAGAFMISNTSAAVAHSTSAINKTLSATDIISDSETPVLSNVTFTNTPVTTTNSMSDSGVSFTNVPAKTVTSNSLLSGKCFPSLSSVPDLAYINLPEEETIPAHTISLAEINLPKIETTPSLTESLNEINLPKVVETSLIDCLNEINTPSSAVSVDKSDLQIAATPTPIVSFNNIELPEEVIPSLPINFNNTDLPKKEATPSPTLSLDKIDLLKEKVSPSLSVSFNKNVLSETDHVQLLPDNQEIIKIKTVDLQTSSEKSSINKSKKIKALQEKCMRKEVLSKKHKAIKGNIVLPIHGPLTEEEEDFILLGINKEDMQPLVVPKPPPPLLIQQHSIDKTESDVIKSTSDSGNNASHENASVMYVSISEAKDVTENSVGKENDNANIAIRLPSSDSSETKQKCNESHILAVETGSLEIKLNDRNWNEKHLIPEEDTISINKNYSALGISHDSLPKNINQVSDEQWCSHKSFSTNSYKTLSSCKGTNVPLNEDSSSTDIESSSSKECALFGENKVAINELQSSKNVPLETKLSTVVVTTSHNSETINVDSFIGNKDSISVSSYIPSENSNPSKEIILNEDTNQFSNETAVLIVKTEHCINSEKNTSGGYESSKECSNRKQLEFLPNDDYKTSMTSKNLQHTEFLEGNSYLEQSMSLKMDSTQIESSDLPNEKVYIHKKNSDKTGFDKSILSTENQTLTSVGCKIQHQTEAACTEVTFSSITDDPSSLTVLTSPCEIHEVIHKNKSECASQNVKRVIADVLKKVCYFTETESYKDNEDVNNCNIFSSPVDGGNDSENFISNNSETVLSVSKDFEIYEQKEIQSCIMQSSGNFIICEANSLIDNNNIDSKFVCNSSDMNSDAFSVVHKQSSKGENMKKEEKVADCHDTFELIGKKEEKVADCHDTFELIGKEEEKEADCHDTFELIGKKEEKVADCHDTFELIGKNCGLIENQKFSVGKEISKAENSLLEIADVANDISDAFSSQQVTKCISEQKTVDESLSDIILASETHVNERSLSLMTTTEKLEESQCSVTKELQILHSDLDVNLGSVLTSKKDNTTSRLENSVSEQCPITPCTTNFENVIRVDNPGVSNIYEPRNNVQQEIHIVVNASNDETEANNILNIGMEMKEDEGNHKCITKCDVKEGKRKHRSRWDMEDKVQAFICVKTNSEIIQDSTVNRCDSLENVEFCSGNSGVISNDIITDAVGDISSFNSNTRDQPKYNEKNQSYQEYNLCTESNINSKELCIINPVTQGDGNKHYATEISSTSEVFPDKNKQNYSSSKGATLNEKPQWLDFSDADCISLRPDDSHKKNKSESQETCSLDNECSSRKSSIMVIDRRDLMKDNLRSKESNKWIVLKDENIPNIILLTPDLKISDDEKLQEGITSEKVNPSIIISQETSSVIHKNISVETSEQNILTKAENSSLSYGKVATDMPLVSNNDLPASFTTANIENSNMTSEINSSDGSESAKDKKIESETEIGAKHEVYVESSKTSSKEEEGNSETVKVDTICESK